MKIEVPALAVDEIRSSTPGESSATLRCRVEDARALQLVRQGRTNALLGPAGTEAHCTPDAQGDRLLRQAIERLTLSTRAYHRILRLARTIADLAGRERISSDHVAEAIQYRRLDAAF